jgi:hypothetical protein
MKRVTTTASAWLYSTREEVEWWSGLWAERVVKSAFAKTGVERGIVSTEELQRMSEAWKAWGACQDGWFAVPSGEILCWV